MKTRILVGATLLALASAGTATAQRYDNYDRYDRDDRRVYVDNDRYDDRATCNRCGEVVRILRRDRDGHSSGVGAVTGAIIGGLVGNQVGGGSGKKIATVGGAIAGGVAGNNIEKNRNDGDSYDLVVEMDNGRRVTISQRRLDGIREGDRVYVTGGRARLI